MAQADPQSEEVPPFPRGVPVQPGDVLAGKYRVERVLGSGGMGVVVRAVHVELGQRVALKFLLPHALAFGETHSRFLREAKAVVQIESEHVARVLDFGRLESGAPYLVMEYLDGEDLSARIDGPQPVADAVDFVLQACAAMAVAHSVGIVHRDLKPGNLFITRRPDGSPLVKVLDFGISKLGLVDTSVVLTHSSTIIGSPRYMSPEQARNARAVDARTDIWSLGAILYQLLTGVPPFQGESLTEVLTLLATANPEPIAKFRPDVPARLEQVVLKALEKPLERRYQNVGEFSAALVEFAPPHAWVLHDQVLGVLSRAGIVCPRPSHSPSLAPSATTIAPPSLSEASTVIEQRQGAPVPGGATEKTRRRGVLLVAGGLALTLVAFALGYRAAPPNPSADASRPTNTTPPKAAAATVAPSLPEPKPLTLTPPPEANPVRTPNGAIPGVPSVDPVALPSPSRPGAAPSMAATESRGAPSPQARKRLFGRELPSVSKKSPRALDPENPFSGQ